MPPTATGTGSAPTRAPTQTRGDERGILRLRPGRLTNDQSRGAAAAACCGGPFRPTHPSAEAPAHSTANAAAPPPDERRPMRSPRLRPSGAQTDANAKKRVRGSSNDGSGREATTTPTRRYGAAARMDGGAERRAADERGEAAGADRSEHELREAGRTMRYKEVVKTRASLLGIEDGIDGGATRDLLEKGAITGYQQGLVRAVIANAVHTGKRWEQATCRFCDAGVPEDEQHMWWDCVKWSDVRGAYPNVLARRPEMKPCMALCGVMPKDAMGLDFDECRELAAGMQLMCVEILLGRQRADGILEQDCRRKELKVSTYPWGWEPQRPTASQTINVGGARSDRNAWKDTHEMHLALAEWWSTKAVENIAQRQPKERWTVAGHAAGRGDGVLRRRQSGERDQRRVAGAGAVFYDKGVKQWEVEKPIAGRATNNLAEYVGFVSVHIPRELNKDADELSNRAMDTRQAAQAYSDRRHRPTATGGTGLQRQAAQAYSDRRHRPTATGGTGLQRQAAQAYSDRRHRPTATGGTGLQRLGDRERVGDEDRAEQVVRVKAVHPALEMRVNHLTSLGGPIRRASTNGRRPTTGRPSKR
ncbi:hypothetical protein DIPPA_30935 [Diplonema papillatum]|nr:hypothetical protein DIPPA_30935 [Diplonema papillatum]